MVNESGDASVWIYLEIVRSLVFALLEGQMDGLVGQSQLFKNDGNFPNEQHNLAGTTSAILFDKRAIRTNTPAIRPKDTGVQGKLLSVRHLVICCVGTCR